MAIRQKSHRDSHKSFLGYNATGQKGLEGALRATETPCVPLLENQALTKVSWVLFSFLGTLREHKLNYFSLLQKIFLTAFIQRGKSINRKRIVIMPKRNAGIKPIF